LGVHGAVQIGAFSTSAVPVVVCIQQQREDFRQSVTALIAQTAGRFILMAPTSRFVDARMLAGLKGVGAQLFTLADTVFVMPSGKLQATREPNQIFAAFLPGFTAPAPEQVAREVFAALEKLDSQGNWRKAPPSKVLRLYYGQGLSRNDVAKRCGCVPGLISARLELIERTLKMDRSALRGLSSHLQKIEESLSDSRARRIDRKRAIYGDDPEDGIEA
jgi:hypothetical protein